MFFCSGTFELLGHAVQFFHEVRVADFGLITGWCLKWVLFMVLGISVVGMIDVVFFFSIRKSYKFVFIEQRFHIMVLVLDDTALSSPHLDVCIQL